MSQKVFIKFHTRDTKLSLEVQEVSFIDIIVYIVPRTFIMKQGFVNDKRTVNQER